MGTQALAVINRMNRPGPMSPFLSHHKSITKASFSIQPFINHSSLLFCTFAFFLTTLLKVLIQGAVSNE